MKKTNQQLKRNKNMTTKSVRKNKNKSSLEEVVSDYVLEILSSYLKQDDIDLVRSALKDHQSELKSVITKNITKKQCTKLRKKKDPNAPKRGKSSYIFFCVDKREEIKKTNPDMSATDIIKELGRVWSEETSKADKAKYKLQSKADQERYNAEIVNYRPSEKKETVKHTLPKKTKTAVKKKTENVNKPRKKSGYILYCQEQRVIVKERNPDFTNQNVTKKLGANWKALSVEEKTEYNERAAKC